MQCENEWGQGTIVRLEPGVVDSLVVDHSASHQIETITSDQNFNASLTHTVNQGVKRKKITSETTRKLREECLADQLFPVAHRMTMDLRNLNLLL